MRSVRTQLGLSLTSLVVGSIVVIVFTLAGVQVAGVYLPFLLALLVGGVAGCLLGLGAMATFYALGRSDTWQRAYEAGAGHVRRQQEGRDRYATEIAEQGPEGRHAAGAGVAANGRWPAAAGGYVGGSRLVNAADHHRGHNGTNAGA